MRIIISVLISGLSILASDDVQWATRPVYAPREICGDQGKQTIHYGHGKVSLKEWPSVYVWIVHDRASGMFAWSFGRSPYATEQDDSAVCYLKSDGFLCVQNQKNGPWVSEISPRAPSAGEVEEKIITRIRSGDRPSGRLARPASSIAGWVSFQALGFPLDFIDRTPFNPQSRAFPWVTKICKAANGAWRLDVRSAYGDEGYVVVPDLTKSVSTEVKVTRWNRKP